MDTMAHVERAELVHPVCQHADLAGEQRQHLIADGRMGMHGGAEHGGRHAGHRHVRHRHDAGGARRLVDCRQLAEKLAGIDLPQQHLAAGGLDDHANGPAHDEKHVAAGVLIVDNPLTRGGAPP